MLIKNDINQVNLSQINDIETLFKYLNFTMQIAKGPNILNLHAYTQGEEEFEDQGYQTNSQRPPLENSKSIQDQFDNFIREINKYDEVLRMVAADLDDAAENQQFFSDFYPEYIVNTTYELDQQKKIVLSSDPQMGKVITNLEKTNKTLKDEIKGWSVEFSKTTRLSQTLLSQNQILRKAICTKNKQLLKLIESISNTQNQDITQMKENLEILREQNGVLLDHLQKIKQIQKQKRQDEERLKKAYAEKRTQTIDVEKDNALIEDQEQHLSKTVALIEDSLDEFLRRKRKLQKQKSRLMTLKQDYTKDQSSIDSRLRESQQDKVLIEKQLKNKFEENQDLKRDLMDQIEEETQKIQKIKEDARRFQADIQRKENRLQEFNKINKDLKQKQEQNKDILGKLSKQQSKFIQEEGALQAEIYILQNDVESMKQQVKEFEKIEKELQQNYKQTQKVMDENHHKQLVEQKSKLSKEAKEMVKKIFEEKLQLSLMEKQVQDWQIKISRKKDEMNELKSQMREIRGNQTRLSELKSQLLSKQVSC